MYSTLRFLVSIVLICSFINEPAYSGNGLTSTSKSDLYFKYFLLLNPPLPAPISYNESLLIPDYHNNPKYKSSLKLALDLAEIVTGRSPEDFKKKMNQVPCKRNVACSDLSIKYILVLGSFLSGRDIRLITKDYMSDKYFDSPLSNRLRANALFASVAAILGKSTKDIFNELKSDSEAISWEPNEPNAAVIATRMLLKLNKAQYYKVFELTEGYPSYIKKWLTNISILSGTPVKQLLPKYESHSESRGLNLNQLTSVIIKAFGSTNMTKLYTKALATAEAGKASDTRFSTESSDTDDTDDEPSRHSCMHTDGTIYYYEDGTIYCGEVFFDSYGIPYDTPPTFIDRFVNRLRRR